MARNNNNKVSMLEAGQRLVHRKGFNHTGINEILEAADAPKGTFYYYFESKEDFGLSLVEHLADFFNERFNELTERKNLSPVTRLKTFFDWFMELFERSEFELGCPVGNLTLEMADLNEKFRTKLEHIFTDMREAIATTLDEAITAREIRPLESTRETADFIIDSWEGAILRMKAQKSAEPLQRWYKMIFRQLLQHPLKA